MVPGRSSTLTRQVLLSHLKCFTKPDPAGNLLYQNLQDTADVCRSYEQENRRELYDMGDNIETVPEEEFYEQEEIPSYQAVNTVLSQIMKDRLKDFVKIQPNGEIQLNMAEQISVTL